MIKKYPEKKFALIASSDMTHCGEQYNQIPPQGMTPNQFAKKQDQLAIEQILKINQPLFVSIYVVFQF